jgi:phosphohistidine phosphatase
MAQNGLIPHRVLCSGARRAVETLELASEGWDDSVQIEMRDEIYHGSIGSLLEMIHGLSPEEASVLLVGHNPAFEDFALVLAGSGEESALEALSLKYPTGALAILDFDIDEWSQVAPGLGFLRGFIRPKALK